jgi:hypothetical protein
MQNHRSNPWRILGLLLVATCLVALSPWARVGVTSARADVTISMGEDSTDAGSPDSLAPSGGKDVVRMGENIEISPGEMVEGDVVAIGGAVTVYGHVLGDVVSVGGGIDLKSSAEVNGDVVCVGGVVDRDEGATVHGQNVSVGVLPKGFARVFPRAHVTGHGDGHGEEAILKIWSVFVRYAAIFLVGLALYLAFQKRATIVRETTRSRFWLSLVVGCVGWFVFVVALILLCITCIGIVVAIPAFFLALIAGGVVGMSLLGELITRRPVVSKGTWAMSTAVGIGVVLVLKVLGVLLESSGGAAAEIGNSIQGITLAVWIVLIVTGFGGLVISRVGRPTPVLPVPDAVLPAPSSPPDLPGPSV